MNKMPLWALWTLGIVGLVSVVAGTLYVASWIALPLIKVPFTAHKPFIIIDYWTAYPKLREGPLMTALMIAFMVVCSPLALFAIKPKRSLHGDAKFATSAQVKKAGLLADKGIIVGQRGRDYLIFGGQQHVLMSAPTRSGKGVGIVIPNLLNWPDSVVVLDVKQENWDVTAGFRASHGHKCFLFNPAAEDRRTHRYNPLDYIGDDPAFRINDVQKIAGMLYPDLPGVDPIWNASCRSLFVGIVLYLKETPALPCTLGQVLRSTLTAEDTAKHFKGIIEARAASGDPLSSECVSALNDFIAVSSDNTRSSIKKTFTSRLELWLNPVIDAATAESDFNLRDLRRKRMSVYVGITPDNLDRLQPIINLLFQQILDQNTRELPSQNDALKYSCLLLMDEFTAIGRINVLSKGISYIAGYNLRMLPIIQSPAQLREVYGKDAADTFTVNHALQIVFAPREFQVAKEISESLGYETVKSSSISKAKSFWAPKKPNESISDQRRALLLPQEVRDIGPDNSLILLEGTPPIQARKIKYYEDKIFTARLMKPPEVPKLQLGTALTTVNVPSPAAVAVPATSLDLAADEPLAIEDLPPMTANQTAEPFEGFADDGAMLMPSPTSPFDAASPFDDPLPTTISAPQMQGRGFVEPLPTTVALTDAFDPFAPEPIAAPPVPAAATPSAAVEADRFAEFSLDFSDVQIPSSTISPDELRRLHAAFLAGATT